MTAAFRTAARKLTTTKIRAISLAGKALLAKEVFARVCREARGTLSFYFESALAGELEWARLYRVFYICQALQ